MQAPGICSAQDFQLSIFSPDAMKLCRLRFHSHSHLLTAKSKPLHIDSPELDPSPTAQERTSGDISGQTARGRQSFTLNVTNFKAQELSNLIFNLDLWG